MPLVISGKLSLPVTGQPASNAEVRFRAVNSVGEIIQGAESIARCDAQGNYTISIEFARYELSTKISTVDFIVHGLVTIDSETSASDLEDLIFLIGISDDSGITDDLIKQFLQIKADTEKAAAEAKDSAAIASGAEVAITPMYNYFNANYPSFETNYADFASKYPDVVAKHGEVVTLASQASDDAVLAGKWASFPEDSQVEPGKYSALHWAMKAQYNANQTFISGGLFAPKSGAEYPDVSGVVRDTIWIVSFDSQGDTYTFTGGQLAGKVTSNADMMFYDTPTNTWNLIKTSVTGGSGVLSVDGDTGPNVNLESKYFWANNRPSISDVDNLQVELNKKLGKTEKAASASDSDAIGGVPAANVYSESNKPTADDVGAVSKAGSSTIEGQLTVTRALTVKGDSPSSNLDINMSDSSNNKQAGIAYINSSDSLYLLNLGDNGTDNRIVIAPTFILLDKDPRAASQGTDNGSLTRKDYVDTKEPSLGNPSQDGMVLSSTKAGVRSWVAGGNQDPVELWSNPSGVPDGTSINFNHPLSDFKMVMVEVKTITWVTAASTNAIISSYSMSSSLIASGGIECANCAASGNWASVGLNSITDSGCVLFGKGSTYSGRVVAIYGIN